MSKWSQRAKAHFTAIQPSEDAPETPKTPLSDVMGAEIERVPENNAPLSVVSGVPKAPVSANTLSEPAANAPSMPVLTDADVDDFEERAAILEFDAGLERQDAQRHARILLLKSKGVAYAEAEQLASLLALGDSRHLCFECKHLQGYGRWRCANALQADVSVNARTSPIAQALTHQLQNCPGFSSNHQEGPYQ